MKALVQRVTEASVTVAGDIIGEIKQGMLVLLGVELADTPEQAVALANKVAKFRMFSDANDKMNLCVSDIAGQILVVPQFTLAADTQSGRRPSFSTAAPPSQANALYLAFVAHLQQLGIPVATGEFGADMQVALINDGPVTFMLQTNHSKG